MSNSRKETDHKVQKNKEPAFYGTEEDDIIIKSHLKASFDLNKIQVSEELISRTLEAIKVQEEAQTKNDSIDFNNQNKEKKLTKKIGDFSKYIRIGAGAAAAIIILLAGTYLNNGMGHKMDMNFTSSDSTGTNVSSSTSTQETSQAQDTVEAGGSQERMTNAESISPEVYGGIKEDVSQDTKDQAEDDSILDDSVMAKQSISEADTSVTTNDTGTLQGISALPVDGNLTFTDIIQYGSEDVKEIKIMDMINNNEISLSEREDIVNFFTVMDSQKYSSASDNPASTEYKVVIYRLSDEQNCTLLLGNGIMVESITKDTVLQSIYHASDDALLSEDLKEYFDRIMNR